MITFEQVEAIDARLQAAGVPPLTPWWREQLAQWLGSGKRRLAARVGRGGAKSHTAVKLGLTAVLAGSWNVPPGERHYFAFVSQNKSEAGQRLRQLEAWLRVLRMPFTRSGDEITLDDLPLGFRVFAAQVGAVSGFRCIGFVADELAKWTADDGAADPAPEVLASLRAMCVTHSDAIELCVSSPLGKADAHYALVEQGDTGEQCVCIAPSWIANPAITEEQTRKLEPDPRVHTREYAAVPQDAALGAFQADAIDAAFRPLPSDAMAPSRAVGILDPSSGGSDAFTWCVLRWRTDESGRWLRHGDGRPVIAPWGDPFENPKWKPGAPVLEMVALDALSDFWGKMSGDQVLDRIAQTMRRNGVRHIHGDQRERLMLEAGLRQRGFKYTSHAWTNPSKATAVETVRRWLRDRMLILPKHETLRRELRAFEERILPSGQITYGARRSGHDDYVALLLTAAHAELDGDLPASPHRNHSPLGPLPRNLQAFFGGI